MNLENMSKEEIDKEIKTYKDRIETLSEYISEIDDARIIPTLNSQLQGYRSTLNLLQNKSRSSNKNDDDQLDIDNLSFKSSTNSLFDGNKLRGGPYGQTTIQVNKNGSNKDIYEVTITNHDDNHSDYTSDLSIFPIKMKKEHLQFNDRLVLHTFQKTENSKEYYKSYGLGIVYKFGNVSEIIFDIPEDFEHIVYLP